MQSNLKYLVEFLQNKIFKYTKAHQIKKDQIQPKDQVSHK
mgnify:CR=1 FL=1|jgi:hypothetical protein